MFIFNRNLEHSFSVSHLVSRVSLALALCFFAVHSFAQRSVGAVLPDKNSRVSCNEHVAVENHQSAVNAANAALASAAVMADSAQRFEVLVCRAGAYKELKNAVASERDFREALRIAAKNFDPFDARLTEPLTELGRLRLDDDDPDDAELFLLRAKDITHRNAGVYNVEQDAVLADLSDVFVLQDRQQRASKQQALRLRSARETYGETPELVEALHNYARWNAEIQSFSKVRLAMEEALSILEESYGVNDPRLVDSLKLRSTLYRQHPAMSTPKAGAEAMQRVVDIYAAQEYVDQVDLLEARKALGDWYILGMGKTHKKGIRYYKKSVKQAIADNVDDSLINKMFGDPELIYFNTTRAEHYDENAKIKTLGGGLIRVTYSIGANGIPRYIKFVENSLDNPDLREDIFWRVTNARFRPRFANGKAVKTDNVKQKFKISATAGSGLEISEISAPQYTAQ